MYCQLRVIFQNDVSWKVQGRGRPISNITNPRLTCTSHHLGVFYNWAGVVAYVGSYDICLALVHNPLATISVVEKIV